ncbi:MAG: hypothetical protein AAFU79_10035 [Myxococcota bacterium]
MTSSVDPYLSPSARSDRMGSGESISSLRAIQKAHRGLIIGFLGQFLSAILMTLLVVVIPSLPAGQTIFALFTVVWVVAALGFMALLILSVVRLALALGWGGGVATLCFLAMFIGLLNLIVILVAAGKAKERLQAAGLPVGFLGVNSVDFDRWARRREAIERARTQPDRFPQP